MSEYMFGVSRVRPTRAAVRKMEKIAKEHDACLIEVDLPGTGYQRWFCAPNLGFPFDRATSDGVRADMERAGLLDEDGELLEEHVAAE